MDKTLAHTMARTLMDDHGLTNLPFEWSRGKRAMGTTHFQGGMPTKISLSSIFTELLTEAEIRDTVLHEIAHALAGYHAGHGYVWQAMAIKIGASPFPCKVASAAPVTAWTSKCANGHAAGGMHRAPLRVKSCSKCSPRWNPDHILTWYKNDVLVPLHAMPQRFRNEIAALQQRGVI